MCLGRLLFYVDENRMKILPLLGWHADFQAASRVRKIFWELLKIKKVEFKKCLNHAGSGNHSMKRFARRFALVDLLRR